MFACRHVHVSTGVYRGQKNPSDPLELQLQSDMRLLVWLLQAELRSYARAVHALNC